MKKLKNVRSETIIKLNELIWIRVCKLNDVPYLTEFCITCEDSFGNRFIKETKPIGLNDRQPYVNIRIDIYSLIIQKLLEAQSKEKKKK